MHKYNILIRQKPTEFLSNAHFLFATKPFNYICDQFFPKNYLMLYTIKPQLQQALHLINKPLIIFKTFIRNEMKK